MNAALLAQRLKALGVPVISSEEPEYHVDGMITVSDRITISVPLEGSTLELLEQLDEETFEHCRRTRNVEQIAQDAKAILARHASEPSSAAG